MEVTKLVSDVRDEELARLREENQSLRQLLQERDAQLAILQSVQEGLASRLDVQSMYNLVGDKIREIFAAQGTAVYIFNQETEKLETPYCFLKKRYDIEARPFSDHPIASLMLDRVQPIMYRTLEEYRALGGAVLENSEEYKSGMYVPLLVGKELKGMLGVANLDRENAYDESHLRLLTTLADSMSVALENARLFAETEQRAAELQIINSVQEGLASKLDIQSIYELVGDKIREIFHHMDAEIRIYDPVENVIRFPYITDNGQRMDIQPIPMSGMGVSAHVMRSGQTLVINENILQEMEKYGSKFVPGGHQAKSAVFVPLVMGRQVRGLIVLGDLEHEHAFSESDVRLLQTLSNSMSTALENARLFDETQRLLQETEQRAAELQIINSVQEGLASKLDMQAIYDLVGEKIRDLFQAQSVWIQIYDHAARTREFKYGFYQQRLYIKEGLPYNKLTEHLIATKKALVINQDADARREELEMVIVAGSEMFKSAVFVPLIAGDEVKGVITIQDIDKENAFSESDVNLLSTLASSMSVALENARLFDETQRLFLEAKDARNFAEQSNQAKSAFLSSMSHELRTPLNAIINFVEMVARGMIGPVNQEQVQLLDQALHSSKHLLNLINDVLDISKIQAGQLTLFVEEDVSVQVEIESTLSIVGGLIQEKGLHLVRDIDAHLPMLACDRRRLRQVLLNLVSNAIKFTNEGTVTVSVKNQGQQLLFAVIDTGPGIPRDEQDRIFEPFLQAENGERQLQGTGLGLPISRSLIRAHGGELWVESEPGDGSAFFFTLPVDRKPAA